MLDRTTLNIYLGAILTTLAEQTDGWVPRSVVWQGLLATKEEYDTIENILVIGDLCVVENDTLRITPKGREMAKKITEFNEKKRK